MCADGELHAFVAFEGNYKNAKGGTHVQHVEEDDFLGTSTPALTEESSEDETDPLRSIKRARNDPIKVPLVFKSDTCVSLPFHLRRNFGEYENELSCHFDKEIHI